MKPAAGIAIFLLAGAVWSQNSDLTPRQIFDFGIKAPAANKPNVPLTKSPGVSKPKASDSLPATPPIDKIDKIDKPENLDKPLSSRSSQTAPDNLTRISRVSYAPLALRYSILEKMGNAFQEVDSATEFHSGDRIRIKVEANGASFLYIVMGGSSGQWRVLFPAKNIFGGDNSIRAGQPCTIPPESDPAFLFDETPGVEKVSLILSRSPEADLEKLIYAAGDPTRNGERPKQMMAMNNPIDGAVMGHVREQLLSRDLMFEKVDGPASDGKQEKAVYAATRDKSPDARLFVDLKLTHHK